MYSALTIMFLDGQLSQQNLPLGFSTSRRSAFSSLHSLSLSHLTSQSMRWLTTLRRFGWVCQQQPITGHSHASLWGICFYPTHTWDHLSRLSLNTSISAMLHASVSRVSNSFRKSNFLDSCSVSLYCTSCLCALLWWCSWYVFTISPVCALIGPLLVRCPLFFFFPASYRAQHIFDGSEIHATFSKSF